MPLPLHVCSHPPAAVQLRHETTCISASQLRRLMGDRNPGVSNRVTKYQKPASIMQPGGPERASPTAPNPPPSPSAEASPTRCWETSRSPRHHHREKRGKQWSDTHRTGCGTGKTCQFDLFCDRVSTQQIFQSRFKNLKNQGHRFLQNLSTTESGSSVLPTLHRLRTSLGLVSTANRTNTGGAAASRPPQTHPVPPCLSGATRLAHSSRGPQGTLAAGSRGLAGKALL